MGFGVLDSIVQEAIRDEQIPGAVVLIGHDGQVIYRKAFGERSLEPRREPMTVDTIFDLASLTKVVATTTAVMQLVQKGEIRVNEPVVKVHSRSLRKMAKKKSRFANCSRIISGLPEDLDLIAAVAGTRNGIAHGVRGEADLRAGIAISV